MAHGEHMVSRLSVLLEPHSVSTRAMLHDANEYSDPENFYPERFMASNVELTPPDPRSIVYGFGRWYVLYPVHLPPLTCP